MKKTIAVLLLILGTAYFYIITLPPAFKSDDSPETITDCFRLGIQHAPGYPLYTMAGKVMTLLPLGSAAFRVNLTSLLFTMILLFVSFLITGYLGSRDTDAGAAPGRSLPMWFWGIILTGISYLIWNQGIEAKGGIYALNLLLTAVVIYSSLRLPDAPGHRYLYLMVFAFCLSLANQWPSAIITGPIVLYKLVSARSDIGPKRAGLLLMILLTGLSPYLYLFIRMPQTGSAPVNFLWYIIRGPYLAGLINSPNLVKQVLPAAREIFTDISFLIAFMVPGLVFLYRRSRKAFYILLYVMSADLAAAAVYNAFKSEPIYILSTFLLPAVYIAAIVSAAGIYYTLGLLREKMRMICAAITLLAVLFTGLSNFDRNNLGSDYLAYDYGRNILKTMKAAPVLIAAGDINILPLYYLKLVEKERPDLEVIAYSSLETPGGCGRIMSAHPGLKLVPGRMRGNIDGIIRFFSGKKNIYTCGLAFGGMTLDGLLNGVNTRGNSGIFDLYSYRGLCGGYFTDIEGSANIPARYWDALRAASLEEYGKGNKTAAVKIFRKAEMFHYAGEAAGKPPVQD